MNIYAHPMTAEREARQAKKLRERADGDGSVQVHLDPTMEIDGAKVFAIYGKGGIGKSTTASQAAWRFFANERVTLEKLIEPLRQLGRDPRVNA